MKFYFMDQPMKYLYNPEFFERLVPALERVIPEFDGRRFIFGIFNHQWPDLDFAERKKAICTNLHKQLPKHFPDSVSLLLKLTRTFDSDLNMPKNLNFISNYVAEYGADFPEQSVKVLKELTSMKLSRPERVYQSGPVLFSPAVG
jgi:hypothetical protein